MFRIEPGVFVTVTCDLCGQSLYGEEPGDVLMYTLTATPDQPWREYLTTVAGWRAIRGTRDGWQCDTCAEAGMPVCEATGHDFVSGPTHLDTEFCRYCATARDIPGSQLDAGPCTWERGELRENSNT